MVFFSESSVSVVSDVIIAAFLTLLTVLAIAALIVYLCKNAENDSDIKYKAATFAVIFGIGFALRTVFALCIRGYRDDYAVFTRMFDNLEANGLKNYYRGDSGNILYPVVYLVYLVFGGLSNVTGLSDYELGMQFMIKFPLIVAELACAFAVYKIAAKYFNKRAAVGLCAFVCVCPIFFIGSGLWTTPVVFTAMFACFACYFMARKKCALTIVMFTAAAFCSKEGIYLFPVACVFALYRLVSASKAFAADKSETKSVANAEYRAILSVPISFTLSVIGAYCIGLLMIYSHSCNFFSYFYEFLIAPFVEWSYFTQNGLSVYTIFNQSGAAPGVRFPSWVFACVFAAIIVAVVCVVYFTKRNRATLVMLAAYSVFTMQVYYPGTTAVGMQTALPLLIAAYALVKDKRLLHVLFATGIVFVINAVATLALNGYLNNLGDFYFGTENEANVASNAVGIVCSVVTLIAHLYFTYVAVSVGMTGNKKRLSEADGFVPSIKEYFSVKKD